jgi:hypothetical protein
VLGFGKLFQVGLKKHSSLARTLVNYGQKLEWFIPGKLFQLSFKNHSSLAQTLVNYGQKSFITLGPGLTDRQTGSIK